MPRPELALLVSLTSNAISPEIKISGEPTVNLQM
jgi:hypothetical protein